MRGKLGSVLIVCIMAAATLVAQTAPKTASKKKSNHAQSVEAQLEQLRKDQTKREVDAVRQQQLIDKLQDQLQQVQQQLQQQLPKQLQQQAQQLQEGIKAADEKATAAQSTANNLNSTVSSLQTVTNNLTSNLSNVDKQVRDLDHPLAIRYRGVTITPGGFVVAAYFWRSRNENATTATSFGASPFGGTVNAHLSEYRASAQSSRPNVLIQGMVGKTKLTGYAEVDFSGVATNTNQVQTNSFVLRERNLYSEAQFSNGLTISAGNMWTLVTMHRKGIALRSEWVPLALDAQYVAGWDYARQTAFRVTKNFNNKAWVAVAVENPETVYAVASGQSLTNVYGLRTSTNTSDAAFPTTGTSTNMSPDLVAKVAFDSSFGHFELKALGRTFRDRNDAITPFKTHVSYGGAIGGGFVVPVIKNKLDLIGEVLSGSGIGRYGVTSGADVTVRPSDNKLMPIRSTHTVAGFEWQATKKLTAYLYGGGEYYQREAYVGPGNTAAGYGSPLLNNANCYTEVVGTAISSCPAQNRVVLVASPGLIYRFYRGPHGTMQMGTSYEFTERHTWQGLHGFAPVGRDNIVYNDFRYYLP